jgi:integrase
METQKSRVQITKLKDGQLSVYKRMMPDTGKPSRVWYYDIKIPRQPLIRFRTTRTADFGQAVMVAETAFQKVAMRVASGLDVNTADFMKVAKEALEYYRDKNRIGEFSDDRINRFDRVYHNLIKPYFGELNKEITEVNTLDIEDYCHWRKLKGKIHTKWKLHGDKPMFQPEIPVSNGTINMELQMLRKIWEYAVKREYILPAQVPTIKSYQAKLKENRRPHFTEREWLKITQYLAKKYEQDIPPNLHNLQYVYKFNRQQNRHLWLLLMQSSCRIGEIRHLRWGNINFVTAKDPRRDKKVQRAILDVNGKTGRRQVVCMPYAVPTLERWRNICAEYYVTTNEEDYVFRHPPFTNMGESYINKPIGTTNNAFQDMLKQVDKDTRPDGLLYDADGKKRSIYSIRHSSITFSLLRNVDINAVSKNAGVSIETMTRVYDHAISTDFMSELTKFDPTGVDH